MGYADNCLLYKQINQKLFRLESALFFITGNSNRCPFFQIRKRSFPGFDISISVYSAIFYSMYFVLRRFRNKYIDANFIRTSFRRLNQSIASFFKGLAEYDAVCSYGTLFVFPSSCSVSCSWTDCSFKEAESPHPAITVSDITVPIHTIAFLIFILFHPFVLYHFL